MKLEYLLTEEAKASDAAQRFQLAQQIEEARAKIAELERHSATQATGQPRGLGATNTTMTEKDLRRDLPQLDAASFARFLAAVDGATSVAGDGATAVKAARVIEWAAGPVGPGMELLIQTYVDLFGQATHAELAIRGNASAKAVVEPRNLATVTALELILEGKLDEFDEGEFISDFQDVTGVDLGGVRIVGVMRGSIRFRLEGDQETLESVVRLLAQSQTTLQRLADKTGLKQIAWTRDGTDYELRVSPRDPRLNESTDQAVTDVVVLVHGIRDWGAWHQSVRDVLQSDTLRVTGPKYGYFHLIRFLSPWDFGQQPLERVLSAIRDARTAFPDARISIIAHSFGTYLVARALRENPDIEVFRLIFCGSVVPQDFRWSSVRSQIGRAGDRDKSRYIVNDCGNADIWPVLGMAAGWRYGNAGTDGFGDVMVSDRFHNGGHGLFFDQDFQTRFWKPFITEGEIVKGDAIQGERVSRPFRLLAGMPLNWLIAVVLTLALAGLVYGLSGLLPMPQAEVQWDRLDAEIAHGLLPDSTRTPVIEHVQKHTEERSASPPETAYYAYEWQNFRGLLPRTFRVTNEAQASFWSIRDYRGWRSSPPQ